MSLEQMVDKAPARTPFWRKLVWRRLAFAVLGLLGVAMLVGLVIMGRVCADAKPSGASAAEAAFFAGQPAVLDLAHRGASKDAPEHSAAAFELALAQGADVLELDLRATRDRVLLVAHDASMQRTLGITQRWSQATWADVVAQVGVQAPARLEDVLARFPTARLNLELKDDDPSLGSVLAEALAAAGAQQRVLVASAHHAVLEEFRRASNGAVATSASLREARNFYFCYLLGKGCPGPYVALQLPTLDWLGITGRAFIEHAHRQRLLVHYWTVDDEAAQRKLLAAGADGIITNQPEQLARLITELRPRPAPDAAPAIVFLGDSLTAGLGLEASEALPARIQQRLDTAGLAYRTINAGRSGDTSAGGLARLDWYFRDSVDLRALVIGLGSNDAMRGLSLAALEQNLTQIIRRTRQRKPAAKLFLWALETFPNLGPEYAGQYAAVFPRVAAAEQVTLIPFPLADVAGNPELNQEDGIHPTAAGTELVAERIWSALRAAL